MKKIIITLGVVFALSFANAQDKKEAVPGFSKGDLVATGSVSFVSRSYGGNSTVIIAPSLVYFTSDNVSVSARYTNEKSGPLSSKGFGIGTAYHFNAGKQFSTQLGATLDFGSMKNATEDFTTTNVDVFYGINYFISKHLAFGASIAALSHHIKSPKNGAEVETTTLGLDTDHILFNLAYKF
jgi:hypothetical protein